MIHVLNLSFRSKNQNKIDFYIKKRKKKQIHFREAILEKRDHIRIHTLPHTQ